MTHAARTGTRLTALDELFVHQMPEPLPHVVTPHEHWRESYFFVAHRALAEAGGDTIIVAPAHYPRAESMDCLVMGRVGGEQIGARYTRPYDGDPHTTLIGPARIDIVEPFQTVKVAVDDAPGGIEIDMTFTARTVAFGLRRGRLVDAKGAVIWDQSHMIQSGTFSGSYRIRGKSGSLDGMWGQRDHSWGIRDHARCPLWIWIALQFEDGMLGVWHWETEIGGHVYTDGCFAPAGGGDPIPVIGFRHSLDWTGADGAPVAYGDDGSAVLGLIGRIVATLAGGDEIVVDGSGQWCAPYKPFRGGGQHLMDVTTGDGRRGAGVYEVTGFHHHRYFPVPLRPFAPPG